MSILTLHHPRIEGDEPGESSAEVDVVAVHGLYESAYDTWTEQANGQLWLRDMLPYSVQNTRVLAYSYPSQKLISPEEPGSLKFLSCATNLIAELYADRWYDKGTERPIIFVCHGFGGLLVKRALIHSANISSRETEHLRSIYLSTHAILFFGTPHQGLDESFLQYFQRTSPRSNLFFLNSLRKDSSFLADLADQFAPLRKRFRIYHFYEQNPSVVGDKETFIVSENSAAPGWDDACRCGISATHSRMVKFIGWNSPGCRTTLSTLMQCRSEAPSCIHSRWHSEHEQRRAESEKQASREFDDSRDEPSPTLSACGSTKHRQYHVPHSSSSHFVGRRGQSKEARQRLSPVEGAPTWRKPKILVVCGLGGSGKTQFALRFAEETRSQYWGTFWVDATSPETLENGFSSLGMTAGKGLSSSSAIHWLSTCLRPWLLILDNADDPDVELWHYFPAGGNGHIMITTRNPGANIYSTEGRIKLGRMDPEEATVLLLQSAYPAPDVRSQDPTNRCLAAAIAKRLGYLAIALIHAGATIRRNIYTFETYLHYYLDHRRVLLSAQNVHSASYSDTITTWEIPFQRIAKRNSIEHKDAVDLMHLFAFLHFESIPEQMFRRSWHNLSSAITTSNGCPQFLRANVVGDAEARVRFRRGVRVLYDHSLIDHDPDKEICSVHPVVHRWAQERLPRSAQLEWLNHTITVLASCIPRHLEASGRRFRQALLPHIDACLRELKNRLGLLPDTISRATEIERFASVYAENGRWKQARNWQESIFAFRRQKLGRWDEDTFRVQKSLAETKWNLFEIKDAILIQREILTSRWLLRPSLIYWISWPPWKPDHLEYCLALNDLTETLWLAGQREWSKYVGERAVRGLTKRLGTEDPQTLKALFNLARTYLHLGDQQLSQRLLVKVLVKRKRLFGMDHPDTLMTRNELGMSLCARTAQDEQSRHRQLAIAERLVTNVLATRRRIFGEEHAYTLWSVNDLSKVFCERQRGAEAAGLLEAILEVVSRTLGDTHRWKEAESLLKSLLKVIPLDHPDSVNVRSGLVHVQIRRRNLAEAEAGCLELFDMMKDKRFKEILAPGNPRALKIYEQMLQIYRLQNRPAELQALSVKVPAAKVSSPRARFDMLPIQKILRRESELDRLY
ncbi:hypothetical protein Z517_03764 [Fonsecaea pedrosoi CBS 271.37]|uniref:NB-ARC domain-containing protein n=1 Tax=Fonsecaea pedrosoi CBS 271.37 TaxID=1442368 RepID=A0A0D2HJB8_9EURO|nr:uncharacterized protein Z517_03764 [Fonsecaea pedrosoi CBS 271.37]KIW84514.1 hypothetical protein Z517_03764 [Fonsecaea pedrosoi CBS 271.37]